MTEEKQPLPPSDTFIIQKFKLATEADFYKKEVFMSAGLVRRLAAIVDATGDVAGLYSKPVLQELLLTEMLRPRGVRGQPETDQEFEASDFHISTDEGQKLLEWAIEHLIGFFEKAVDGVKLATDPGNRWERLMSSSNGLMASLQQRLSAGVTDAPIDK